MTTEVLEVSPRDYHQKLTLNRANLFDPDSWLSTSALKELKTCSLKRWRFSPNKFTGSKSADWGTIIDCLITTPEEIGEVIEVHNFDSFRTKEAREVRDDAIAQGKIFLSEAEMESAMAAAKMLLEDPIAGPVIKNSRKQVVLLSQIEGINCKGLVDIAPENEPILYDLKTTADFSVRGIANAIQKFGYYIQAGIYLKLWNNLYPEDQRKRFRFIWQSSSAPYEVAVTELPAFDIEAGSMWAAEKIHDLIKAQKQKKWPNIVGDKVAMIGRPGYAEFQDMEELDELPTAPE